jgi:hypothetical protein
MKLQHLFEAENELGFDEKYTRDENPEIYKKFSISTWHEVSSFDGFPRKIGLGCDNIDLNNHKFTNLIGFPEFVSDEAAKQCQLFVADNPLTTLEGAPKFAKHLNISHTPLTSLEGCPEIQKILFANSCKNLTSLKGLKTSPSFYRIEADNSGLTSLEGCPEKLESLIVSDTKISSFEGFPKYVKRLMISPFKGCLTFVHEKIHDEKTVRLLSFL